VSVRILYSIHEHRAVLYDSVTMTAFGPVVHDDVDDAQTQLEEFLEWLPDDARRYTSVELDKEWGIFASEKE
jgi:hypothetical protein